jgi:hypothetical protein
MEKIELSLGSIFWFGLLVTFFTGAFFLAPGRAASLLVDASVATEYTNGLDNQPQYQTFNVSKNINVTTITLKLDNSVSSKQVYLAIYNRTGNLKNSSNTTVGTGAGQLVNFTFPSGLLLNANTTYSSYNVTIKGPADPNLGWAARYTTNEYNGGYYCNVPITCTGDRDGYLQVWGDDLTPPSTPLLTFLYQSPSNLTSTNGFGGGLNVSYNVSDSVTTGLKDVYLQFKTNNSIYSPLIFINGSNGTSGFTNHSGTNNTAKTYWNFTLEDNEIYPGTYNLPSSTMEGASKLPTILQTPTESLKIKLFNVSNSYDYGFLEMDLRNDTAGNPASIYYCNSTYLTGTFTTNENCASFCTISSSSAYNHSHGTTNNHMICPFSQASGKIGGVTITGTSYFLIRGASASKWNVSYVSLFARTGQAQTTGNTGITWANFSGTPDVHLHQFSSNDTLHYRACGNYDNGTQLCETLYSDMFDQTPLNPAAPSITNPNNYTEYLGPSSIINVTWTNSTGTIYSNLSLIDADSYSFVTEINTTTQNSWYNWNSTNLSGGHYRLSVRINNSLNFYSTGFSEDFWLLRENFNPYSPIVTENFLNQFLAYFPSPTNVTPRLNLTYNATIYYPSKTQNSTGWLFTQDVRAPYISTYNATVFFNLTGTVTLSNGTNATYSGLNLAQNITQPFFGNCLGVSSTVALNVSFFNEENFTSIPATLEWAGTIETDSGNRTTNGSAIDTSVPFCLFPPTSAINATITFNYYNAMGYSTRQYYLDNSVLTATTSNLSLYLQTAEQTANITVRVIENGLDRPALVQFQRYYVALDAFRVVSMVKTSTDSSGSVAKLRPFDVDYLVVVLVDGIARASFYPVRITSDAMIFDITSGQIGKFWTTYGDISGSCAFTNSTGTISCTVTDGSGLATSSSLIVKKSLPLSESVVCSVTSSTAGATHICNLGNSTDSSYSYLLTALVGGETITLASGTLQGIKSNVFGTVGLFLAALIILAVAMSGAINPASMILMAFLGVLLASFAGLAIITTSAIIGLGIVGGLLIYRVRT